MIWLWLGAGISVIGLIRKPGSWWKLLLAWLAFVALATFVILPMHQNAYSTYARGYTSGSVLQGYGPMGSALGAGMAARSRAEAEQMLMIANTLDTWSTFFLLGVLSSISFGPKRNEEPSENPSEPAGGA